MTVKANYLEQIMGDNPEALMAIREIPRFRQSSTELLKLVYRYGRIYSLEENEELTRENEFDQWVYFILGGSLDVYVGEDWVDTISSSLVGERCILGEPRRATLRAGVEGITALGVDMALLDSLASTDQVEGEEIAVWVELLSLITAEIVDRIAELADSQADVLRKHEIYHASESVSSIVESLKENGFRDQPKTLVEVFKFLQKHDRVSMSKCRDGGMLDLNTARLYVEWINAGRYDLIQDLGQTLHDYQALNQPKSGDWEDDAFRIRGFAEFVRNICAESSKQYEKASNRGPSKPQMTQSGWQKNFKLGKNFKVDLNLTCDWLRQSYGYSDRDLIDILMLILHESSSYTAAINTSIKGMIKELGQIRFLRKLENAASRADISIPDIYTFASIEEMIPVLSKHVLDVHLVSPYMEALESLSEQTDEGQPEEGGEASGQDLVDSLFD